MAKKKKKPKKKPPLPKISYNRDIPVYDFFEDHNFGTKDWDLGECLNTLI